MNLMKYSKTLNPNNNFKIKSDIGNINMKPGFNFKFNQVCNTNNENVIFGSQKAINEKCPNNSNINQIPCMNIWNNSTKRKIIVND